MHANFIWFCLEIWEVGCTKKEKFWLVSEARWSAATWIKFSFAMEFTEIHSTRGNLKRLKAGQEPGLCFCWSDCFSRQIEGTRRCGPNPHLVQARHEDQWGCPAEDADPKSFLFYSTRHAGPHQVRAWTQTREARRGRKRFWSTVP